MLAGVFHRASPSASTTCMKGGNSTHVKVISHHHHSLCTTWHLLDWITSIINATWIRKQLLLPCRSCLIILMIQAVCLLVLLASISRLCKTMQAVSGLFWADCLHLSFLRYFRHPKKYLEILCWQTHHHTWHTWIRACSFHLLQSTKPRLCLLSCAVISTHYLSLWADLLPSLIQTVIENDCWMVPKLTK